MSINEPCFKKLFERCCKIIDESDNQYIHNKRKKLFKYYKQTVIEENPELQEFYSLVHELKVYDYLKKNSTNPTANNDNFAGPDFLCDFGYVECISLTKGSKNTLSREDLDNRLKGWVNRHLCEIPRIASAIKDKKEKYETYLKNKNIDENKPRIIAVGTAIFSNEFHESLNQKNILQVLYGIGNEYLTYNQSTHEFINTPNIQTHHYDGKVKKNKNTEIDLGYFFNKQYANISAIILVSNSIFEEIKPENFKFLLNPLAVVQINKTTIKQFDYFHLKSIYDSDVIFEWVKKTI